MKSSEFNYNYQKLGNVFIKYTQHGFGDENNNNDNDKVDDENNGANTAALTPPPVTGQLAAEIQSYRNPKWPPTVGREVQVKDGDGNNYKGTYVGDVWNNTAGVIKLSDTINYTDNSLRNFQTYSGGKNHFLLLPTYYWSYSSLNETVQQNIDESLEHQLQYHDDREGIGRPSNNPPIVNNSNNSFSVNRTIETSQVIGEPNKKHRSNNFTAPERIVVKLDARNKLNKKVFNKFLNFSANLQNITPDMIIDANNPYYKPTLSSNSIDFSGEDIYGDNAEYELEQIASANADLIMEKLKKYEPIKNEDVKLSVNKNIAINALIVEPEDELNEGNRIIKYIDRMMNPNQSDIFTDLIYKIHEGHVFITRKGAKVQDTVTENLTGPLHYFAWQLDKPIDYHTLKYVLFQNEYQRSIAINKKQREEADTILGLEYIIGLQCKSEYQLWCLKRLLMIWYADKELEPLIRKIKILINHYRADPSQDFNVVNGVLPMITIYPRYGVENAKLLLAKLDYYFSLYVRDDKSNDHYDPIYIDSKPTYFIKKTNLLYYSNGSLDLKAYIKESLDTLRTESFTVDMSKIRSSQNII